MDTQPEDPFGKSCIFDETTLSTPGISGGCRPGNGFSLKEYEEQLNALKKENFNLKLRIYFAEERKEQMKSVKSIEDAKDKIIDLSVQLETLRKELSEKDELLVETAKAMDVLQRSYQTKSEALQILSSQKLQVDSQNEALKKELMELKRKLDAIADDNYSLSHPSQQSQLDVKKMESESVACQSSFVDSPKKVADKATSPCVSELSESALREQVSKMLAERTKAMETIQYLVRTNKRLRQQRKETSCTCTQDQDKDSQSKLVKLVDEKNAQVSQLEQELQELELKLQLAGSASSREEREEEDLRQRLNAKEQENAHLRAELQKRTYNLQELVNKELWSKNREIEKLNKLAERRHAELVALKSALKRTTNVEVLSQRTENVDTTNDVENKENAMANRFVVSQLEGALADKAKLSGRLAELELAEQTLREQCLKAKAEAEMAEKMLKESTSACQLLTTRLEELAGFLDSLVTQNSATLSEEKRRVLQEAVAQSRLLSKSLSASFNVDATYAESADLSLKCSSVEPILPDYSEINFSSEEDAVAEVTLEQLNAETEQLHAKQHHTVSQVKANADLSLLCSEVMALTEQLNAAHLDSNPPLDSENAQNRYSEQFPCWVRPLSSPSRIDPMFSVSGRTLENLPNSRFKKMKSAECGSCGSESEAWSEPDRSASLARIGLSKESIALRNPCSETETSENTLEDLSRVRLPGKQSKKMYGKSMKQKLRSFEEMNSSLRQEIQSLHSVIASVSNKITDEEMMRQLRSLNNQLSNSHSKCAILEKQLITANMRCQTLLVLLEDAQLKSKDSYTNPRLCGNDVEAEIAQEDIISLERQVNDLKRGLTTANATLASFAKVEKEHEATAEQLKTTQSELENERMQHAATRQTVVELRNEVTRIQGLLQEQKECILEKECALLEAQNRLKECAIEFELRTKETQDQCVASEKRAKDVENSLREATTKLLAAESRAEELAAQLKAKEDQFKVLESEAHAIKREAEESRLELNQRESELSMLKREFGTLKLKADEAKVQLDQRETELNTLKSQCEKEVAGLKSQLDAFRSEEEKITLHHRRVLIEMSEQIDALKRERREALKLVESWRAKVDALVREKAEIEESVQVLKAEEEKREKAEKIARETEAGLRYQLQAASSQCAYAESHARNLEKQYKEEELERVKRELERRVAELEAANGEMEAKLSNIHIYKESYSDGENTSAGEESLLGSPVQIAPLSLETASDAQTSQRLKTCISTLTYHNHIYLRQRSENSSDYVSDQEMALPLQINEKKDDVGTCSPDLGIESDQGRASSSEQVALCKSNSGELQKLEEENVTLRNKLFRTKQALEETLNQLSTANKKKRQVESAICKQLHKTHHILKKARVNLELRSESSTQETSDQK